jgi:serine/threonine protein kinase/tetratricopeptide (TPR) repeat protein
MRRFIQREITVIARSRGRAPLPPVSESSESRADTQLGEASRPEPPAWLREQVKSRLFRGQSAEPAKLGRFEIERELGRGGMGEVILAYDPQLRRRVAIKRARRSLRPTSPHARERALREAQALARVNHPNVIEVYEVGVHADQLFVAMEYVEGQTLTKWLASPRGWREILAVFVAAGRGLAAAHRAELIHRDFKPDNVLVSGAGDEQRVRVLDFGLARFLSDDELTRTEEDDNPGARSGDEPLTQPGALLGTLAYMAPEQLRGETASAASDQFAFCVALVEALWGEPPFEGSGLFDRLAAMERGPALPRRRSLPRALAPLLRRGLAFDPADRWPSVEVLLDAIERVVARRRTIWISLTAASLLSLGILIGDWLRDDVASPDRCEQVEAASARLWSVRRATLARIRFAGDPSSHARFARIDAGLAAWSQAWHEQRASLCESGETEGARVSCYDRSARQVESIVDALVEADATTLAHADALLDGLPALQACHDDEATRLGLAPPPLELADAIEQARDQLATANTLLLSGHLGAAESAILTLRDASAELDYPPFAAELALVHARVLLATRELHESLPVLEKAARLAAGARHDRVAASAYILLADYGARQPDGPLPDTEQWLDAAELAAERLDMPEDLAARLLCTRGTLLAHDETQRDEARALLVRGLEQLEGLEHDAHWLALGPSVGLRWRPSCMLALAQLEDGATAITWAERAVDASEQLLGSEHPQLAKYRFELARLLLTHDPSQWKRAVDLMEAAATTWLREHDGASSELADAYFALAMTALERNEFELARSYVTRAEEIYDAVLAPDDYMRAQPILARAEIEEQAGHDDLALAHFERARPYLANEPQLAASLVALDHGRVRCLHALGRSAEAEALREQLASRSP